MSNKAKRYFVKDESLHSTDGDMFNYADISKVLNDIIATNEPPYNIAVIGKWGLGKSSLINLVTNRYKKDTDNYFVQEINAWKYEKESLRRVFLKQLWQGLSSKKIYSFEVVRREISDIIKENLGTIPNSDTKNRTRKFVGIFVLLSLLSFFALLTYKYIQAILTGAQIQLWYFLGYAFLSYCKNIGTVLFIPTAVALFKVLIDDYHKKQSNKIELTFPIETTDDYEIFLETKIKDCLSKNPNLKIVTVIDDLDRLSIDKIVEALDALKAFVGFDRCIFIVPFDDEIIKHALDKQRTQEFDGHIDVIESELILDKLFQFKIYLPPILDNDMRGYAIKLAKQEIPDFMNDYCNEDLMQKAIERVIIHPNVSTPRQVKKLLNAFVNNYMIVSARESSGKIQKGLLTSDEGTMQIAKISVLQADFNAFYDLLFLDMKCPERILALHRNDSNGGVIPYYLSDFFTSNDNEYTIKREYEPLVNFLIRTEKYTVPSIAPFLYLAQDDISIKTGDELQRRAINALTSGNVNTLKTMLQESENIAEVITYYLSSESNDLSTAIYTTIEIFNLVDDSYKTLVATVVIDRTLEFPTNECQFLYEVPATNIFDIADHGDGKSFASNFIDKYISIFIKEDWLKKEPLLQSLAIIIQHWPELLPSAKSLLKQAADFCIESNDLSASDLISLVNPKQTSEFMYLWAFPWFEKISSYIDDENDFSQNIVDNLCYSFQALKEDIDLNTLIAPILNLIKYATMLPTIADILNQSYADGNIKDSLSKDTATAFAESTISHNYEENETAIYNILTDLPYVVNTENGSAFDTFTIHFRDSNSMDDVLVYCGMNGHFVLLPKTINALLVDIFEDEYNDALLRKVAKYFTNDQKLNLSQNLIKATSYVANKDYQREISILEILAVQQYGNELDSLMAQTWIPQFNSYYSYQNYFDFITKAVCLTKDFVSQQTIDSYVQTALVRISSQPKNFLYAINQVSSKMSASTFKTVFDKIVSTTQASDFDLALEAIINNDDIRSTKPEDLVAYRSFLVKNLSTTTSPAYVLKTIDRSFSRISSLEEMVQNALKNQACDLNVLNEVTGKFLNNSNSPESAADTIIRICTLNNVENTIMQSFSKIKDLNLSDILQHITAKIEDTSTAITISNLVTLACNNLNLETAYQLLIRCLEISFSQINQTNNSIECLEKIKKHTAQLSKSKKEFVPVLKLGFTSTTSDSLKKTILELVRSLRIKPQFKKDLTGDDLEFYNKEIG